MGLGGVTVRLSGMADSETATDDSGQYSFTGLRAGTYSVEISGFDSNEVSFSSTSGAATVDVGETKVVTFDGTYLRTAGIMGQVSVDGEGLGGVTVTLMGGDEDATAMTDAGGLYAFSQLKSGTYQVAISGYDTDDYEFETTSKSVTIATGETANVPFEGTLLRTAGIAGRVSLDDGMGLDGVTVTLAGAAEATTETSNGGQYAFAGLAAGTYVLSITNPNETAFNFTEDEMMKTVMLEDDQSAIVNFSGTHTRTASVSGMLFIDEVMQDRMHTTGEPSIAEALAPLVATLDEEGRTMLAGLLAKAKVKVTGPSLSDPPTYVDIDPLTGTFSTGESLIAGSYQVELPVHDEEVMEALELAGVAFVGESMVVEVEAGGDAMVNFPFRITHQTVSVGAAMGSAEELSDPLMPVGDVELELYPTAEDAEDGTNMLGKAGETDAMTGMAAFTFARDMDTSPGSDDTDNIVFVKVAATGHDDLTVSDNPIIEIQYPGVARVHAVPAHVRLLNTAVRFQFWIKSDKDARSGDMLLDGWHTQVYMGEVTDESEPLMKADPEDEDGEMVNLTDPSESSEDDDGEQGRVMVSYPVTPDDLPADFTVMITPDSDDWQQPMAMGEKWEEVGDGLTYTHTGFELPAMNTHEENDLNMKLGQEPARVTFTTQKLTVGVYREADDEAGFTNYQSRVSEGDHRPEADVAKELSVSVMVEASGRRGLEVYDEWDHDDDDETDPIEATINGLTGGMATFGNLPADMNFTVQFDEGSDRVAVGGPDSRSDRVQAFGDDLELGKSVGAFGDMGGAGPEVTLCPLTTDMRPSSLSDDDSDCATFAYQWATGTITGDLDDRKVKGLDVSIEADTDVHSEAPRDTETDKDGKFGWSDVQDGVYNIVVASSDDYNVTPTKGIRVDVYHDEFEDDEDEDTEYVGTAGTDHAEFSATRLRLSIRGYVANVSHEENDVVRGDETYEGAELEIYEYDSKSKSRTSKEKGNAIATATVDADGLYSFDDLDEGAYVIIAKNTDDYEMYHGGPDVHWRNNVQAMTYGDVDEESVKLPLWNYEASTVTNPTSPHTVGTGAAAISFTFYNFALLHGDGDFSGRVREARGEPDGIAVELRRCETYTAAGNGPDGTAGTEDDVAESCKEETDFGAMSEDADSRGRWEFNSLREGYYVTNIAATTYNQARYDDRGRIDDDAIDCAGTGVATTANPRAAEGCDDTRTPDAYGSLKGKRAFNRGGATFYVYNRTLGDADELTALVVEGTPHTDSVDIDIAEGVWEVPTGPNDGTSSEIAGARTITWESGSVTVDADDTKVSADASFAVISNTGRGGALVGHSSGVVTVPFTKTQADGTAGTAGTAEIRVRVTAENGYNDHDYTFTVTRAAPVDNNLTGITANPNRSGSGTGIDLNVATGDTCTPGFAAGCDEYNASVPVNVGIVYVFAATKPGQTGITAQLDGADLDAESRHNNDGANVVVYKATVPETGVVNKTVTITVTSEDGVKKTYYVTLNRS